MKRALPVLTAMVAAAVPARAGGAPPVVLGGESLEVAVDPAFPRIISYRLKPGGATLAGQAGEVTRVELNGKPEECGVAFTRRGADAGEWRLAFAAVGIEVTLAVTVGGEGVELRVTEIAGSGAPTLVSLAFPGNALVCVSSDRPAAQLAALRAEGYGTSKETLAAVASLPPMNGPATGNYLFLSNGDVAAGIAGNHLRDVERVAWQVTAAGGAKTCAAWRPVWQCREAHGAVLERPWTRVLVTGDRNGDGAADWQDAALAWRSAMPQPPGAELVRWGVADQVAMNFASLAQQPFLRILDGIRKVHLLTDGLGQVVTIKGYTAEGHDSANTDYGGHYNQRAGGLEDLTFLLENAARHNARVGVHINATEVYPEAHRYRREILDLDAAGNPKGGWAWLDHSHLIDKRKDILTGDLFRALERMRRELPALGFVYLDVYGESGWNGWMTASRIHALGLPLHTEYATALDPWTTWAHHRGATGQVMRFLWNSARDIHPHDPLLRGADHVGFMGWQGERDLGAFLRATFGRNLPTKFLQHHDLLRWQPGKEAVFSGGVRVAQAGDEVTCTRDGKVLMTWSGDGSRNRLFVPWSPQAEEKIYVWDEVGGPLTRELPAAWADCPEVFLYQLTARGRAAGTRVPVGGGRVTLEVAQSTPFVLYRQPLPPPPPVAWGEGGPVADPGFNGGAPGPWAAEPPGAAAGVRVGALPTGDDVLVVEGPAEVPVGVSQLVAGLDAGGTYAASVWVQLRGSRRAVIAVTPEGGGHTVHNWVERTAVRNRNDSDAKLGTFFQRLKVVFTLPAGCTRARLQLLAAPDEAGARVEFDDVRVVRTAVAAEAAGHAFHEDFEHVDQGLGPFVYAAAGQTQTHLSETNAGVTRDTIRGRFSLKTRDEPAGTVVRSLPSHLRFKPATRYRIALETLADSDVYRIAVRSRAGAVGARFEQAVAAGRGRVAGEFVTGRTGETFLALEKTGPGGGMCVLDDIVLDELGPAPPAAVPDDAAEEAPDGARVLVDERFQAPLGAEWSAVVSPRPGTAAGVENGQLAIRAAANCSALVGRALPAGTTAVEATLSAAGATGETWGPGLCLVWPGDRMLRVNLRIPERRFGIDATGAPQQFAGGFDAAAEVTLRIRAAADQLVVEARCEDEDGDWQPLARLPRTQFAGDPVGVQLGKSHGVEGTDDHHDPGADGTCHFRRLRVFGR